VKSLAQRVRQNHQSAKHARRRQENGNPSTQGHGAPVELAMRIRVIDQPAPQSQPSHQRRQRKTGNTSSYDRYYCEWHHDPFLYP
jgi:hypothetical protein